MKPLKFDMKTKTLWELPLHSCPIHGEWTRIDIPSDLVDNILKQPFHTHFKHLIYWKEQFEG